MYQINLALLVHFVLAFSVILRIMLRPHREPASRIAWIVVVVSAPGFGILMYLLLGETNIGFRRVERMRKVLADLPMDFLPEDDRANVPSESRHLFDVAKSISNFSAAGGNSAQLMADSNATIDAMVADIDAAERHVHLVFYIWLSDNNGCKMIEALKRAAARGVTCRAMADSLGSRALIKSPHWKAMRDAGVHVAEALPIRNTLLTLFARVDLRNHR